MKSTESVWSLEADLLFWKWLGISTQEWLIFYSYKTSMRDLNEVQTEGAIDVISAKLFF